MAVPMSLFVTPPMLFSYASAPKWNGGAFRQNRKLLND